MGDGLEKKIENSPLTFNLTSPPITDPELRRHLCLVASSSTSPIIDIGTPSLLRPACEPKALSAHSLDEIANFRSGWPKLQHNKLNDLEVIIDSKVFDLSNFASIHPGGVGVLLDEKLARKDATDAFFGLHRHEFVLTPRYARLQIRTVADQKEQNHRKFQRWMLKFVEEHLMEDAALCEEDGKRPSVSTVEDQPKYGLLDMRLGPGEHLKGMTPADGLVKPEEYDYFHELILTQEYTRIKTRGYVGGSNGGMFIGFPTKLAGMIVRTEAIQNWLESLTYQMCNMNYSQQSEYFSGQIGFLKMYATRAAQQTATEAVQIFGGRGLTKSGMGKFIEHYHRAITFDSVLGGAEDVLGDLGVRQAMRKIPNNAKL
ncbi:hypothetical protein DL93DRAFT_2161474 [Clavulina sp. PMI_390]|nr:hypothetical protein DL93DRAFT_2161474 [Clavulina sp. PMI_390]